jgi:hypothetical protein
MRIRTKDDYLDRLDRRAEYERECAREAAREAAALEDNDYCDRVFASLKAGEAEEVFEAREEAMQLARQRSIDFVNGEITRIFAGAIAAVKTAEERRAA